jgi:hypothetical protein
MAEILPQAAVLARRGDAVQRRRPIHASLLDAGLATRGARFGAHTRTPTWRLLRSGLHASQAVTV